MNKDAMIGFLTGPTPFTTPKPLRAIMPRNRKRSKAFGDFQIDVLVDDLLLHCYGGRDGERITLDADDRVHSLRVLLAFAENRSAAAAIDRPEPSLSEIILRWPEVRQALCSDGLACFERDVTAAVVEQFNNSVAV